MLVLLLTDLMVTLSCLAHRWTRHAYHRRLSVRSRTFVWRITRPSMKLKAPEGVGDPCVAGVILASRDGCYEVEPEVGTLLIECFGFMPVSADVRATAVTGIKPKHTINRSEEHTSELQ